MNQHLMFDLETLSTKPTAIPHQIGAVLFNDDFKITGSFFTEPDIASAARAGLTSDTDTIAWWMKHGGITQDDPKPLKNSLRLFQSFVDVAENYGRGKAAPIRSFWAWGSDFDASILRNAYSAVGLRCPWPYWLTRDARTVHSLAFPDYRPAPDQVKHNALQDATDQVARLEAAMLSLGISLKA